MNILQQLAADPNVDPALRNALSQPDPQITAAMRFQQAMALAGVQWPPGYEEGDEGNGNVDAFEWAAKKGDPA